MATKTVEQRLERTEAYQEIQNLMGKFMYQHLAGMGKDQLDLFAMKSPDVRVEMQWGVYEGVEGIKKCFGQFHDYRTERKRHAGRLIVFPLTTPYIQVAGDGKTAKGIWICPGMTTGPVPGKLEAYWAWLKYGADFIKEDGIWKIWHLQTFGLVFTPYDKGWVLQNGHPGEPLNETTKPDKPPTYSWTYGPDSLTENIPAPPEPYETWDRKSVTTAGC